MSEPITRAEFRDFLIHKERVDLLHPGTSPALIFDSWCEQHRTESASPPRVPGPSAQFAKVGVVSGPGQPIDICERMNRARDCVPGAELRMLLAEGEMEIRRLRGIVDECQEAAGIPADQAEDYCTVSSLIADKVVELEDRARTERRAGIEAAALAARHLFDTSDTKAISIYMLEAAIRALADKPVRDKRKGG